MSIRHCLFWYENNMVTAALFKNDNFHIMKIGGEKTIPFTDNYWGKWIEHSGYCTDDKIDFCIIYDKELVLPDRLKDVQCEVSECIWNRNKIQKALELLNKAMPVEIRSENNVLVCKVGSLRYADEYKVLTARFSNAENETNLDEKEPAETTPFTRFYLNKFKEYKEKAHT